VTAPAGTAVAVAALDAGDARAARPALAAVLQDAVDGGASVGFLPPLARAEAEAYWETVADAVEAGARVLLVARDGDGAVVGTAQLDLALRENGLHRAEVMRLMVLTTARRQGIGRRLMQAVEAEARRRGRTTLVLDTRQGDPSERLYRALGWVAAGAIPRYARSADGTLHATALYYKLLEA